MLLLGFCWFALFCGGLAKAPSGLHRMHPAVDHHVAGVGGDEVFPKIWIGGDVQAESSEDPDSGEYARSRRPSTPTIFLTLSVESRAWSNRKLPNAL